MRRTMMCTLAIGTMLLSMAFAGPAAQAGIAQSTSCHLKTTVHFDPGLTGTERAQAIKAKGHLSNCNGGGVTGAYLKGKGSGSLSCTSGTATVNVRATWNTGETSKISLTVDLGNQTLSGSVTSGKFAGEDVSVSNVKFTVLAGDCFFTPVTKARVTGQADV